MSKELEGEPKRPSDAIVEIDFVPCPACHEPIARRARICRHCKSYVDWRRFLQFGTTTLALLTALIAVIGSTAPTIVRLFGPDDSQIHGALINGQTSLDENLRFIVSNDGRRPGAVTGGFAFVEWQDAGVPKSLSVLLVPTTIEPYYIEAKSSRAVVLSSTGQHLRDGGTTPHDVEKMLLRQSDGPRTIEIKSCKIQLDVMNASGLLSTPIIQAWCPSLRATLDRARPPGSPRNDHKGG